MSEEKNTNTGISDEESEWIKRMVLGVGADKNPRSTPREIAIGLTDERADEMRAQILRSLRERR